MTITEGAIDATPDAPPRKLPTESGPHDYRLASKADGELILQGRYRHWDGWCQDAGIEWREIPTVDL